MPRSKVTGVGSVGTVCAIALLLAGADDALFLQIKQARRSVLEPYAGKSAYRNDGQRVVVGQRLMQSATDLFLGWSSIGRPSLEFLRTAVARHEDPVTLNALRINGFVRYAGYCCWALGARARQGG